VQGQSVIINVLANDTYIAPDEETLSTPSGICAFDASREPADPNCQNFEVEFSPPSHGTISISNDSIIYTADADFVGSDSFNYSAYQLVDFGEFIGTESALATVNITISTSTEEETNTLTSEQEALTEAIGTLCSNLSNSNLSDTCGVFNGLSESEKIEALNSIAADQVTAQSTSTVNMTRNQGSNVAARLSQLKNESTPISIKGLTLKTGSEDINGKWLHAMYDTFSSGHKDSYNHSGGGAGSESTVTSDSPFGFFINGSITTGDKDSSSTERGYDLDSDNITLGVDYRYSNQLVFGAAYGFNDGEIEFSSTNDMMENSSNSLLLYGAFSQDNFYASSTLGYTFGELDTARRINFGTVDTTAKGNTDTQQLMLQLSASYDFSTGGLSYGPYMKLDIVDGDIEAYSETNGAGFEVSFDQQDISSQLVTVGAQAQYAMSYSWGVLLPSTRFEFKNELNDEGDAVKGRFALDPSNTEFSITADEIDAQWLLIGAGVSAVFQYGLSAYLDFETTSGLDDLELYTYSYGGRWEISF